MSRLFVNSLALVLLFTLNNCTSTEKSNALVNLALKRKGETYVFSHLGTFLAEHQISNHEAPLSMPFLQLFRKDKHLYLQPNNIKELASILAGTENFHPFPDKHIAGYLSDSSTQVYQFNTKNVNTTTIGKQKLVYTVKLTNPANEKQMNLVWQIDQNTISPVKNCKEETFSIEEHPYPGKTVYAQKQLIVVDLEEIARFFGSSKLSYVADEQILYVIDN